MKILVLGGGGFLGINLTKALLANQYSVRVFERPGKKIDCLNLLKDKTNLEWYEGDFTNRNEVSEAIQGCDFIYHLISTTLPKSSNENPAYDIESNVISSIHMMESARENGVKKIIFASSGGTVYGTPKQTPISETHPTDPICSYGISKLAIEKYLALFYTNGGPDYTILRLANPYGYHQSPEASQGAIAVFIKKAINGESVEIWGDGSIIRDYIYVDDVIDAMLQGLIYQGEEKIFNIGSDSGFSINKLLDSIDITLGCKTKRIYSHTRNHDVPVNILDINRAKKLLQWHPAIELMNGLKKSTKYLSSI